MPTATVMLSLFSRAPTILGCADFVDHKSRRYTVAHSVGYRPQLLNRNLTVS